MAKKTVKKATQKLKAAAKRIRLAAPRTRVRPDPAAKLSPGFVPQSIAESGFLEDPVVALAEEKRLRVALQDKLRYTVDMLRTASDAIKSALITLDEG